MMKFIKSLTPTASSIRVREVRPFDEELTFRMFNGIQINEDLWISVQASYSHYCSPRRTFDDLSEYNSMEFALMDKNGFISVSSVLPDFHRLAEIEEYHDTVYGYVPVNLIEDLFEALNEVTK